MTASRRMEELDDKHLEISIREALRSMKERAVRRGPRTGYLPE